MPYKSKRQEAFFNSPEGKKKIGKKKVDEWNDASKGLELPERVSEKAAPITSTDQLRAKYRKGK